MSTLSVEDFDQEEAELKKFLKSKYNKLAWLFLLAAKAAFSSRIELLYLNSAKQWFAYLITGWAASWSLMDYFWDSKRSMSLFNQIMLISGISIMFCVPEGPFSLSDQMFYGITTLFVQLSGAMLGALLSIPRKSPYQLRRSLIFSAVANGLGVASFFLIINSTTMRFGMVIGVLAGAPVSVCIVWYVHKQYSKKLAHLRNSVSSDTREKVISA